MAVDDDGSRAIAREINRESLLFAHLDKLDIVTDLEIEATVALIRTKQFKRVALQVPDDLLHVASDIVREIENRLEDVDDVCLFVLGDTSYGSCCVDEVAAQHHQADFLVHYGESCMSSSSRLPVHYVFGRLPFDKSACVNALDGLGKKTVVVFRDARYDYAMSELVGELNAQGHENVVVPALKPQFYDPRCCHDDDSALMGHLLSKDEENILTSAVLVYIGSSETQMAQLFLRLDGSSESMLCYNPARNECRNISKTCKGVLNRRFYKIQQAKDASVFGILVGTMGVQGYGKVLNHLVKIISAQGRKSYTFVMGKINPQKLANFPNIDAYVIVACPQNSLIDSKEFFKPVVTPVEVEIALGYREWSTKYTCSFHDLLLEQDVAARGQEDDDTPHFSMATGGLVMSSINAAVKEAALAVTSTALSSKEDQHITIRYSSPAAEYLAMQTFQGLDTSKGDKAPAKAIPGQTGIAAALYDIDNDDGSSPK